MSIEAMKHALEALQHSVPKDTKQAREQFDAIQALRTAIQQAESEPVAVRNPFASRCYTMSESHLSGHRLIVGFEKLEDAQSAHEWVARCGRSNPGELPGMWHESDLIGGETDCEPSRPPHPAPGVPVGWPTDAEIEMNIWPLLRLRGHEALTLHDCIAAIRAASPAQKGGE